MTPEKELADFKRMVELYQAGAVIEYHRIHRRGPPKRFHVGFNYAAMSDDDYFELRELERRHKIKGNANWRGDERLRRQM